MPRVVWSAAAEGALLQMPTDEARAVLDAVEELETSGRGFVRDMLDGDGTHGL